MEFGYCRRCKKYQLNPQNCGCKLFHCWHEDTKDMPDEVTEVYALDYDDAAEKMAEGWFDGSYYDAGSLEIFVKRPNDTELKQFSVEPMIELSYHAIAA